MPRCAAAPLTELLKVLKLQTQPKEVQQRIQQHRAMPGGEHEAVAPQPVRTLGVEAQEVMPKREGEIGAAHRHAGMPGVGLLHTVGGEQAHAVYGFFKGRFGLA